MKCEHPRLQYHAIEGIMYVQERCPDCGTRFGPQTEQPSTERPHEFQANDMGLSSCKNCGTHQTRPVTWPPYCHPKPKCPHGVNYEFGVCTKGKCSPLYGSPQPPKEECDEGCAGPHAKVNCNEGRSCGCLCHYGDAQFCVRWNQEKEFRRELVGFIERAIVEVPPSVKKFL